MKIRITVEKAIKKIMGKAMKETMGKTIWENTQATMTKELRKISALLLTVTFVLVSAGTASAATTGSGGANKTENRVESATGRDMRVLTVDGKVEVTKPSGQVTEGRTGTRLFNGFHVDTREKSYAWVDLDNTKVIKLDAVTATEIREKGKELEILLNGGNMFFNVSEKLKTEETFNIRSSTMVCGIRGTSGWMKVISEYRTDLFIIEGTVTIIVTDPVTGEQKSAILRGGDHAEIWVYDKNHAGSKCDIILHKFTEEEIEGFVAVEIAKNKKLQERITKGGIFNVAKIIAGAQSRLERDQKAVEEKMAVIKKAAFDQYIEAVIDPVFQKYTTDGTPIRPAIGLNGTGTYCGGTGGSSGGAPSTTPSDPADEEDDGTVTLTLPTTATIVNNYLAQGKNVKVVGSARSNMLTVDVPVTVPEGQSLEFTNASAGITSGRITNDGILNGNITNRGTLQNSGTITGTVTNTASGSAANAGTINGSVVNQGGTTPASQGTFANNGTISGNVTNNGRFENEEEVTGSITNSGTLENNGTIGGGVTNSGIWYDNGVLK